MLDHFPIIHSEVEYKVLSIFLTVTKIRYFILDQPLLM